MKRYLPFLLVIIGVILISSLVIGKMQEKEKDLTVYSYDSFISEWGPGPVIAELFEKETGISINFFSPGDAGQTLQRLIEEKEKPIADVALGIDSNLYFKALKEGLFEEYESPQLKHVDAKLLFPGRPVLTPFDFGYFSFIYDSESEIPPPVDFSDLLSPRFREKIIIMDPRTSTPGLGLLLWSRMVFGDDTTHFWNEIKPNLLTVSSGWDTGYGLFTSGEAPLVLSYTTSPAYHLEYEESRRYRALIFPEGHLFQVEGAGVVAGTEKQKEARMFIDFLLSESVQELFPLTNWMYPVRRGTPLPDSYVLAPQPTSGLAPEEQLLDDQSLDDLIDLWDSSLSQ